MFIPDALPEEAPQVGCLLEWSLPLASQPSLPKFFPFQVLVASSSPHFKSRLPALGNGSVPVVSLQSQVFVINSYVNKLSLKDINLHVPFVSCRDPNEYRIFRISAFCCASRRQKVLLSYVTKGSTDTAVSLVAGLGFHSKSKGQSRTGMQLSLQKLVPIGNDQEPDPLHLVPNSQPFGTAKPSRTQQCQEI